MAAKPQPSFWELHRQLADRYVADVGVGAMRRQLSPNGPSTTEDGKLSELPERRFSRSKSPLGLYDGAATQESGTRSEQSEQVLSQRRPSHGFFREVSDKSQRSAKEELEAYAGSRRSGEEAFSEQVLPQRRLSQPVAPKCESAISGQLRRRVSNAGQRSTQEELAGAVSRRKSGDSGTWRVPQKRRLSLAPKCESAISGPEQLGTPGVSRLEGEESGLPLSREDRKRTDSPSLLTLLLELQGLMVPENGDIMSVQLKAHQCWREKMDHSAHHVGTIRSRRVTSRTSEEFTEEVDYLRHLWLHPSGGFRSCWNILVALLVLYDLLAIPLNVFDVRYSSNAAMTAMDISMPIFWCLDCILTFFTGYYRRGELVTGTRKIAWHYASTWMLYDLSLIVLDSMFVYLDYFLLSGEEGNKWSRSLLMLRILRLIRITRAIKLRQGFDVMQDLLHSQAASLYASFLKRLVQLLILNHWVACAWYGVRWLHPNDNWVVKSGMDQNYWTHQYLMCMLWSFCQLGVGESPLQPTNTTEMLLNCAIAVRALLTTATLISTMSNLIAGLRSLREDEATQFRLLRRFLSQHQIPIDVGYKVTQFLQHQFANQEKARSSDLRVPLLDLLSRPLFRELQFERYRESLSKLPMIKYLLEAADIQALEALHSATGSLNQLVAAAGDFIFLSGSPASSAYFKLDGTLAYYHDQGEETVEDTCWVAEACLWTPWMHMGDFEAKEVSEVLCLDADGFCETLSKTWSTQQAAAAYAKQFLAAMERDRLWTDIYIDHELDSVGGGDRTPLVELYMVPALCCGLCPRTKKRRGSAKVQSILPEEGSEPDLT